MFLKLMFFPREILWEDQGTNVLANVRRMLPSYRNDKTHLAFFISLYCCCKVDHIHMGQSIQEWTE